MAEEATAPAQLAGRKTQSIGEVINKLRADFPDLTVSKVRFLEAQGLISPTRSPSGYRMFGEDDVERLRYVLSEQRDHFLPLKVIKSKLTSWDRGEDTATPRDSGPAPEAYFGSAGVSMAVDELCRASGVDRAQVDELISQGVLMPLDLPDGRQVFRDEDLAIARSAYRLFARGYEGRHIRSLRLAADREVDLLSQLVTPMLRHRNPKNRRRAAEVLADGASAGAKLQENLVRARLRRLLEG
ncbi:MAG: MerR family transcriptional regulator [Acidimicrobiia bacterium]|nr:MerR family transcriptional regulator [Acidimicrobiia bacterium]MDX2468072.1 MerR family transcriptional regulator [Acidimicrobiia bacterium]